MQVKIIDIILMYKMFSNEAEDVTSIIDFVTFKIMWLKVIVNNKAIASLFPIFVLSIYNPFHVQNIPTYYLQICRNYTILEIIY